MTAAPASIGAEAASRRAALLELLARRSGGVESWVHGDSMGAALPDGARIRIIALADGEPACGCVVALDTPAGLVAHRVVAFGGGRGRGRVITRGDNRIACDPPVGRERIAGRVAAVQRGGTWVPPPPQRLRPPARRLVAAAALLAPRLALALDPRLGEAVNVSIVAWARLLTLLGRALGRTDRR